MGNVPKVHKVVGTPPNESDSQGDEDIFCGEDRATFTTREDAKVTCRRCLHHMRGTAFGQEKVELDNGHGNGI